MSRKVPTAIILLSAISLLFSLPQPLRMICGFLQVFVIPGMVFTDLFLARRFNSTDRWFFSLAVSPFLLALLVIAADALTGGIIPAARMMLGALYVLLAILMLARRKDDTEAAAFALPWQIIAVSGLFAGLILGSYLYNGLLLWRSDSWYHASVITEVATRGIPPMEPWLSDFPIRYMWIYHLFNALWMDLSGLPLFWAMGMFNVVTAFVFPYMIARYASVFTKRRYLLLAATVLAIAGLESVSWIFVPFGLLRALFGEVRGAAEIQRMVSAMVFNEAYVIHTLTPYGTWMVNLYDKFVTVTAFSYSLNLFIAALVVVLDGESLVSSRVRSYVMLFALVLGTLLFHTVTGTALVLTTAGASVLLMIFGRYFMGDDPGPAVRYMPLAAAVLAALIGLPYILSLGAASGEGGGSVLSRYLHVGFRSIFTIALPLLVLFFPARAAFRELVGRRDYRSMVVICWVAVLIVISILIDLPTVNDSKLIFPLFLVIGPPIYIKIAGTIQKSTGWKRWLTAAAVALLFFVPPVMTVRGFLLQKPEGDLMRRRAEITAEDRRFFDWVRENTPSDAVIIENNDYVLAPVFAARRNFYSDAGVIRVLGYGGGKMERNRRILSSLFSRDGFSQDTIRKMEEAGLDLYVAVWREDIESAPWLARRFREDPAHFEKVYGSEKVSLYAIR